MGAVLPTAAHALVRRPDHSARRRRPRDRPAPRAGREPVHRGRDRALGPAGRLRRLGCRSPRIRTTTALPDPSRRGRLGRGGRDAPPARRPALPAEPAARTVCSYGVRAGDDLHISGLVSFASDGTIVGEGDIDVQVEQVFTNMCAVVEEAGGSMDDIVSTTTYLTDVTQAPSISAARARHFTGDVLPTHTVIGVAALARPQFLVEISAIAHLG
nr:MULTISPECIES: RidA family protein [Kocuria]